jgi:hypothetical protein
MQDDAPIMICPTRGRKPKGGKKGRPTDPNKADKRKRDAQKNEATNRTNEPAPLPGIIMRLRCTTKDLPLYQNARCNTGARAAAAAHNITESGTDSLINMRNIPDDIIEKITEFLAYTAVMENVLKSR